MIIVDENGNRIFKGSKFNLWKIENKYLRTLVTWFTIFIIFLPIIFFAFVYYTIDGAIYGIRAGFDEFNEEMRGVWKGAGKLLTGKE